MIINIMRAVLTVFAMVSVSLSLDINISGTVTDTGTTPLSSAIVRLEKYGLNAITGSDGKFMLTGIVEVIYNTGKKAHNYIVSASISSGVLFLDIRKKGVVEVIAYTLQGQAVSRIKKIMDVGQHSIAQPHIGDGVYLYRIKAGSSELAIISPTTGRSSSGSVLRSKGIMKTASQTKHYEPIDDVIAATKDGYLNYRVIVTDSDTSGIEIKMIECATTVTDIDGNVYQAVQIGSQIWTVENLRTKRYNDGADIPHVPDSATWSGCTTPAYCYFNNTNDTDSIKKYGALYNWYVINTSKLAPSGWHIPSLDEWNVLRDYLIANGYNWDGTTDSNKIAKSLAAKTDWNASTNTGSIGNDLKKNNLTGFSALPGGYRISHGGFSIVKIGYWWTSNDYVGSLAFSKALCSDSTQLVQQRPHMRYGLSVRLLKDSEY